LGEHISAAFSLTSDRAAKCRPVHSFFAFFGTIRGPFSGFRPNWPEIGLKAVVHIEFDGMRCHAQSGDILLFKLNVGVD